MAGRPKGRKDNPVNPRNNRQETEKQKAARIQKTADTRRKNNQATKVAAEASNAGSKEANNVDVISQRIPNDDSQTVTNNKASQHVDSDEDYTTTNNDDVRVVPALNITANLDIDEDNPNPKTAESVGGDDRNVKDNHTLGIQQEYVKAIQLRLREEVKIDNDSTDLWMLEHLKQNNWWIRKERASSKLTREQSYISKAMNTPLPFLPVVTKEERKAYAKYVLENDVSNDFDKAAEVWLKYVDGDKIMPKLKSHLRTYDETWSRNRRVQESDEKAGDGKQRLMELNREISPPTDGINSEWKEPMMPKPLPDTQMQAMHHYPYLVVGGLLVVGCKYVGVFVFLS